MAWRSPGVLYQSLARVDKVAGVLTVAFVGAGVDAVWSEYLPWWAPYAAFGILLLYGFVRANYEEYLAVETERDELRAGRATTDKRAALKDALAAADEKGHELYASDPEIKDAERWVTDTHNLIEAALGKGEARLFLSDAGYTFMAGQNDTRQKLWVEGRLRRLAELMARVDSLDLRPDFDPED